MNYRVLMVCMGNICRSPTAEGVFRKYIKNNNLGDIVEVDSAGTHGYHVGEPPDPRTQRAALARGYNLSELRARKVAMQDIEYFDLILAMDKSNLDNLRRLAPPDTTSRSGISACPGSRRTSTGISRRPERISTRAIIETRATSGWITGGTPTRATNTSSG